MENLLKILFLTLRVLSILSGNFQMSFIFKYFSMSMTNKFSVTTPVLLIKSMATRFQSMVISSASLAKNQSELLVKSFLGIIQFSCSHGNGDLLSLLAARLF